MIRVPNSDRRRGFTLIELLVVIAIIAVLIALLVPAVQKVREAADVTQGLNNLKQMSLGMNTLHGVYKMLPPGVGAFPTGSTTTGTVFYHLLPYIEQGNVHKQNLLTAPIPIYQAPHDASMLATNPAAISYAANGYVFSGDNGINNITPAGGVATAITNDTWPGTSLDMTVPSYPSIVPVAVIPRTFNDGTSNTILFMEKFSQCAVVTTAIQRSNKPADTPPGPGLEIASTTGVHLWGNIGAAPTYYISNSVPVQTSLVYPADFGAAWPKVAASQFKPLVPQADCRSPQGHTISGIGVAMADGSARMINNAITQPNWAYLLLPNDGAVITGQW